MTSFKARLNRSRVGKDGLYPLVIQVIRGRVKRELYTPYRLKPAEFDALSEKAVTDRRGKTRLSEIREINEYLIYIKRRNSEKWNVPWRSAANTPVPILYAPSRPVMTGVTFCLR